MGRVSEIVNSKLTDEQFLGELSELSKDELTELLDKITDIHNECRDEVRTSIKEFRETGIPSDPVWFNKCKKVTTIRSRQMLMVVREIRIIERENRKDTI
jgi:hypothetical protein